MLQVELACQMFHREDGDPGKTSWPVKITEDQLVEIMQIPQVWTPNTRETDQVDGTAIWACRNLLLLVTVLESWRRSRPWVDWLLEILKTDPNCKRGWELRTVWTENVPDNGSQEPILLTEVLSSEEEDSGPADAYIELLLREEEGSRVLSRFPLDFSEEEVCMLVSNIGQEDHLW